MNHSVFKAVFSGIVGILLVVGFLLSPPIAEPAYAQSDDALTAIVDAAKASGARVVIIDPGADTAAADTPARSSRDILLDARAEFIRILGRVGELPGAISAAITSQETTEGQSGWIFLAVLAAVLYLAIGYLGEHYFRAWARRRFLNLFRATPENRAERIGYLIVRAILMLFGAAITTAIALTLSGVLDHSNAVVGELQRILIVFVFLARAVLILIFNLTAPDAASHRSVAMTDDEAQRIYRWAIVAFSIIAVVIIFGRWMEVLGIDPDFKKLILLCSILIAAATFVVLAVANRRAVASALVSGVPDAELSITGRLFSNNWHVLLIVYVATALFVSIVRLLLDQPSALGLVTSPLLIILGGFGLYGVGLMLVDRYFDRKGTRISTEPEASEHEHAAIAESAEAQAYSEVETLDDEVDAVGDDDIGETVEIVRGPVRPGTEAAAETPSASQSPFKQLAEYGVALIVTILCVLAIGGLWGFRETAVGAHANLLFDIGIILFIAYLAWKAVKTAIDVKLAEEAPGAGGHGGGEPGGTGTSRIATLLPLARSVLLITIMAMTAMLVLSELGVEIGPLLAGAGVIGLAVGFGAQTLVRDIISGAFFLFDDALRVGEYVDIGSAKGTVEKITLRSVQLRHHLGPLNTIPFGDIQTLTNFSRDWVIMKLPFRVTYDTDIEKVRKLIKQLGQELLDDPELGPLFLEPVKSQGVYRMEDSAIIIRVKFMTRPGDQFGIRKVVYTRIRELFESEGIKFAHKEVTVRVSDSDHPLSKEEKEAVAGAVRPIIDAEEEAAQKPSGGGL